MDLKEIQDLIRFVAKVGVKEVELEREGFKIVIKTEHSGTQPQQQVVYAQMPAQQAAPAPAAAAPLAATPAPVAEAPAAAKDANYVTIKSPMIGTFYRSSSPDKDVFIKVGDKITKGQTVCIIEAMKLFNEIESEVEGTVVQILPNNASPVEYDQVLVVVDPS